MNTNAHFWSHLVQFFLEWKIFQTNFVEKINILISYDFFFSKLIRFPDRPQITIWSMRIVCWITKATNTLSEYVIFTAFPQQHWLQERAAMLRYTYTGCLVLTWHELKFPSRRKVGSGENNLLWYFITILHFTYGRLNKVLLQSFSWELLGHPCYCLGMWPVRTLVNNVSLFFLPHIFL